MRNGDVYRLHHSTLQPRTSEGRFDGPPLSLSDIAEPADAGDGAATPADAASDVINLPKSLKSSFALHGPFRQGVPQVLARPTFLKDAIAEQVKAFASEDAYKSFTRSIMSRPDFKLMQDSGLFLPSTSDATFAGHVPLTMREERFMSGVGERLPGVRSSSRATPRRQLSRVLGDLRG
ncbi:MAG: hypothetical protein DMF67_06505 [Acidobacteria bacterium]|nr:MAG: hypothetical protein DMF67_06505 [Acidobacteriota bacterium]